MSNRKIPDGALIPSLTDAHEFEVSIGGPTQLRANSLQIKNYVVSGGDHSALSNLTFDTAGHGAGKTGFQRGTTSSTIDPTVNDDDTQGYREGDFWINTTSDTAYVCVDPATGAAIWHIIEHSASDIWDRTGTTIQPANAGDDVDMGTGDITATDITSTNEIITDTLKEKTVDAGITISVNGNTGKLYDYTGSWFSFSGSGTPDIGTDIYLPYTSADGIWLGYGMAATDLISMGTGVADFVLTGDGKVTINSLSLRTQATPPTTINGTIYYDTTDAQFKFRENGIWNVLGESDIWTRTGTDVTLTNAGDTVQFDSTGGIQFGVAGQNIIEFSIDGTMVGDSDTAVPTEKATKTYVDSHVGTNVPFHEILTISTPGQTAFTLSNAALNPTVSQLVLNGQTRVYGGGNDFTVSGTSLTWNDPGGLTLETTDILQIWYYIA